jgi:hypothetical protein
MRLMMKVLASVAAVLVVGVIGGLAYLMLAYPKVGPARDLTAPSTPEAIARGQYLVDHVALCVDCHTPRDWTRFAGPIEMEKYGSGGEIFDENIGLPGMIVSKNITPAGLSSWTDGEIVRAFTEGVSKDGTALFPLMPYYLHGTMDLDDALAIVAYLRTIPAITSDLPERRLNFPLPLVVRTMPRAAAYATRPDPSDQVAYGRYLATVAACTECHTPVDESMEPILSRAFAGGREFLFPDGSISRAANITPDETGIGTWTEDVFLERFARFRDPEAHAPMQPGQVNTVMPWGNYQGMEEDDLRAIYAYLRTVPPVSNRVVTMQAARPTPSTSDVARSR